MAVAMMDAIAPMDESNDVDRASAPSAAPVTPAIPIPAGARMLGKYIMLETLGEGGFSKVKLGIDTVTKEKVALKMLKKDKLSLSSSTRKQVEREIAAMSKIAHPNVIRLREVDWSAQYEKKNGKKRDIILVVLELATGGELFEFLNFTGSFDESIARTYFHQLIAGVECAHRAGVAHRDLKPENLLLDANFVLKLADFGFSNVFTSADHLMYTECGTPGYMAPEMIKNSGYDPTISDIWACGVILFIMLAGFPPFQKPNVTDWWFQKLATNKHHLFWQAHSRNAYFSDATKDFLNKILTPDPSKRISIADMKKHPWFTGTTISHSALVIELTRRKNDVDAAKQREKAEKKKRAEEQAAATAAATAGALGGEVMRGEDDMPSEPPSMWSRAAEQQHGGHGDFNDLSGSLGGLGGHELGGASDLSGGSLGGLTSSGGLGGTDAKQELTRALPPKYDPSLSVACYTSFESTNTPGQILQRISRALDRFHGAGYSLEDDKYKLKASVLTPVGNVVFTAQVFIDDRQADVQPHSVVEFRRRTGDSLHYLNLFNELRDQLSDLIKAPTPTPVTYGGDESILLGA